METSYLNDGDHPADSPANQPANGEIEANREQTEPPLATRDLSHHLVIARGRVHGASARILIDGGAQVDLMSKRFAEEQQVRMGLSQGEGLRVQLIGGQIQDASMKTKPTAVQFGQWSADSNFNITALEEYDVILGKPWLTSQNPQINWRTNEVQLWIDGKAVRVDACASPLSANYRNHGHSRSRVHSAARAAAIKRCSPRRKQRNSSAGERRPAVIVASQKQFARHALGRNAVTFVGAVESVHPHPQGQGLASATQPWSSAGVASTQMESKQEHPTRAMEDL